MALECPVVSWHRINRCTSRESGAFRCAFSASEHHRDKVFAMSPTDECNACPMADDQDCQQPGQRRTQVAAAALASSASTIQPPSGLWPM